MAEFKHSTCARELGKRIRGSSHGLSGTPGRCPEAPDPGGSAPERPPLSPPAPRTSPPHQHSGRCGCSGAVAGVGAPSPAAVLPCAASVSSASVTHPSGCRSDALDRDPNSISQPLVLALAWCFLECGQRSVQSRNRVPRTCEGGRPPHLPSSCEEPLKMEPGSLLSQIASLYRDLHGPSSQPRPQPSDISLRKIPDVRCVILFIRVCKFLESLRFL